MPISTLKPLPAEAFDTGAAQHLLARAGFGGTRAQVDALAALGLDRAVDTLLDGPRWEPVNPDAFDADIMGPLDPDERRRQRAARRDGDEVTLEEFRRARQMRQRADRRQMAEIRKWWLERMIETPRPFEEKMTLFWHGHFATGYRTIEDSYHMFCQNQTFRAHAVGNFRTLAHAVVHDPAMLRYLNNNQNRRQRPNENLARELMELFTLGEGNAYTEDDIKEGARALTGYTYDDDRFVFRRRQHDPEPKRILGHTGNWDGDDFVDIILRRREASEFVCLKLYRFLVHNLPDGPDESVRGFLRRLSALLREEEYELKPVLRTLLRSAHFYDEVNRGAVIKSPVQLIVQAIRSLRTPVRSLAALLAAADLMGQNIFQPPSVKGWEGGRSWINTATLFVRQNLVIYLLTGQRPDAMPWDVDGTLFDATALLPPAVDGTPPDAETTARGLLRFLLGTEPHPDRVAAVVAYIGSRGGALDNDTLVGALSLIAAMPEYQLC